MAVALAVSSRPLIGCCTCVSGNWCEDRHSREGSNQRGQGEEGKCIHVHLRITVLNMHRHIHTVHVYSVHVYSVYVSMHVFVCIWRGLHILCCFLCYFLCVQANKTNGTVPIYLRLSVQTKGRKQDSTVLLYLLPCRVQKDKYTEGANEELHVYICADTLEKVDAAVAMVEPLLMPIDVRPLRDSASHCYCIVLYCTANAHRRKDPLFFHLSLLLHDLHTVECATVHVLITVLFCTVQCSTALCSVWCCVWCTLCGLQEHRNIYRSKQLRELALMNGTCKEYCAVPCCPVMCCTVLHCTLLPGIGGVYVTHVAHFCVPSSMSSWHVAGNV